MKNKEVDKKQEPRYLEIYSYIKKENPKLEQDDIEVEAKKVYEFEKEEFNKYVTNNGSTNYFDISSFLSGVGDFQNLVKKSNLIVNKDDITKYVQYAPNNKNKLMEISYKLYNYIQEYKNLIRYYGDMLLYRPVVNPLDDITEEKFINGLRFLEGYNYKSKLIEITNKLLLQDIYFGYELSSQGSSERILKEMPYTHCNLVSTDKYGVRLYSFDLEYFNSYKDEIDSFPSEFGQAFKNYKSKKSAQGRYFIPNEKKQFAFKFDNTVNYSLPFFTGVFVDMIRLQEIKTVQIESSKSENYKLIWQKIPMETKSGKKDQYLIGDDVKTYHDNLDKNAPNGVGKITTPMDIGVISLSDTGVTSRDIVDRHFSNLMSSTGVSKLVFNSNSTGSTGVTSSIKMDEGTMFRILRQYECFFNRQLNYRKEKNVLTVSFLNITIHNENEVYDKYLKLAQNGYNKFYPAVASGISQLEVLYGSKIEKVLNLIELLGEPLISSYVQTGDEIRNTKDDSDLTDEGAKTRDKE